MSRDLQHARVFFTTLGDSDDEARALHVLQHAQPFIRSKLAAAIPSRYTPELIFAIDHELKEALRIDLLLGHLQNDPQSPPAVPDDLTGDCT